MATPSDGRKFAAFATEARLRAVLAAVPAPVSIRRNARARRLMLRVDAADRGVALVLPRSASMDEGLGFLERNLGWIASRLAALPHEVRFVEGAVVPVLGVPHAVRRVSNTKAPAVEIADGEIRVRGETAHVARRVRDFLANLAGREVTGRARAYAAQVGRRIARITIRETTSRWGSCSAAGALSFSWRLIMAPEAVLDYVVAHEVAHLVEMNHSPNFWRVVDSLVGDYAAHRAWLKRHRSELFAYG